MDQPHRKSWWGRNWKWVVPVGCLGAILLLALFIGAIVALVFGVIRSSDVYQDAVETARASAAVQAALGSPVEAGYLVTGSINVSGSGGSADLAIPLSGPDGEATLYAVASKSGGQWVFSTLVVGVEATGERIDLLAGDEAGPGD